MTVEQFVVWAAGYLEGEGSFFPMSSGRGYSYATVSAASVDREPLARLKEQFGGWLSGPLTNKRNPRAQTYYTWRVRGRKARQLMEAIHPQMSPRRQAQILRTLAASK